MNQWVLVGHRGVGKSSLLKGLNTLFPATDCLSLDQAIVDDQNMSIDEIFQSKKELGFREIENQVFNKLVEKYGDKDFIIDLGAGFQGAIPENIKVLWIKRKIDSSQSRFLDRPSLDGGLTMDSLRFKDRELRYQSMADVTLELREGIHHFQKGEKLFFASLFNRKKSKILSRYFYTLKPTTNEIEMDLLLSLGLRAFEYRDDLIDVIPKKAQPLLQSYRTQEIKDLESPLWDWPLEHGVNVQAPILSLHEKEDSIKDCFKRFPEDSNGIHKLAVPVKDFLELKQGHEWMMESPQRRAFLPMSAGGRWNWYRRLVSMSCPLNFLRFDKGSASDQPSLLEVLNTPQAYENFAAVLGAPVNHSQTPTHHQTYFEDYGVPVFSIDMSEDEFDDALPFLRKLGLKWVAVTAPLKKKAQALVGVDEAINTLYFDGETWQGTNTDTFGFSKATEKLNSKVVAVWGGGGTHASVLARFPQARLYSSRTGELKQGSDGEKPDTLIWAVGAKNFSSQGVMPPRDWPIKQVIDLNYTQDSSGIDCAHMYGCQYQSGLVMFEAQAQGQQEFWNGFKS